MGSTLPRFIILGPTPIGPISQNSASHSIMNEGCKISTGNDRYSGHGYSGIDRYSGTKHPDDAILFTVSGITAIVEQNFQILGGVTKIFDADLSKVDILKLKFQDTSFIFEK